MVKNRGPQTVLIIEDEPDIQVFISRVLELEGYQVIITSDGKVGLKIVREKPVSLVLLDLRLPGFDGWEVLQEMKQDVALALIPVVVVTAVAEPDQRHKTMHMGAAQYLVKPLSANSLSKTVAGILNLQGTPDTAAPEKAFSFNEIKLAF